MPDIRTSYLGACRQLALRYGEVTGGLAKATVRAAKGGGVHLAYWQQVLLPGAPAPEYQKLAEQQLSLSRALDSLVSHVARALDANAGTLSLASMRISEPRAMVGVTALELYCPAWSGTTVLFCRYQAERGNGLMSVTLYPMGREELPEHQCDVWDQLYAAGLVGELPRFLPWAAQGVSQLLMLNLDTGLDTTAVLLPGAHRHLSVFPDDSLVLSGFADGRAPWQLHAEGAFLQADCEGVALALHGELRVELTLATARWQAMCEAIAEHRTLGPQTETTTGPAA
jgi:hypothetical protein